jgi:WD40 repeat protein
LDDSECEDGYREFECEAVLQEHTQDVKFVLWHPSGQLLFSASYDNNVKLFGCPLDGDEWLCMDTLVGHASTVWSLAWHDNKLYSVSDDKQIFEWHDTSSGKDKFSMSLKPLRQFENVHEEAIYSVCVDESSIITAGADCQIICTDKDSGEVSRRIAMPCQVNQVAMDKGRLAIVLDTGELAILRFE